ncbi:hypothetical protein M3Y99_00716900 [Aphelenchoides fujianensis]|nr:hypothetical protein M3Y99_00716900 [Aphelenchoides fujianensis]
MSNSSESGCSQADAQSQEGGETAKRGVELATKVLTVDKKRFYLDVKENQRGRFVQFVALLSGARKSRIYLTMPIMKKLAGLLEGARDPRVGFVPLLFRPFRIGSLAEYPKALGRLTSGKRVYFFDLKKERPRFAFLRLTQTFLRAPTRFTVYVPAEGLPDLLQLTKEIVEEFGNGEEDEPEVQLPPPQQLRDVRNKIFYFDCNSNDFGDYLRITETRFSSDNRTSITVSLKNLARFHEILGDVLEKFRELRPNAENNAQQPAAKSAVENGEEKAKKEPKEEPEATESTA